MKQRDVCCLPLAFVPARLDPSFDLSAGKDRSDKGRSGMTA